METDTQGLLRQSAILLDRMTEELAHFLATDYDEKESSYPSLARWVRSHKKPLKTCVLESRDFLERHSLRNHL